MKPSILVSCAIMAVTAFCAPPATAGHQVELGGTAFHFDYAEDCPPPLKSTERDWVPGVYGAYYYHTEDDPVYLGINLAYARAATAYHGTDQQGTPLQGKTRNRFYTAEFKFGHRLTRPGRPFRLTPYAGFGYKRRDRDLGAYREEYSWEYLPLGLLWERDFGASWTAAIDASVNYVFASRIKVYLSDIHPRLGDATADLGNQTGYRLALPLSYRPGPRWELALTPWYEYSALGRSEPFPLLFNGSPVGAAYEPDSRTRRHGADLGLRRHF